MTAPRGGHPSSSRPASELRPPPSGPGIGGRSRPVPSPATLAAAHLEHARGLHADAAIEDAETLAAAHLLCTPDERRMLDDIAKATDEANATINDDIQDIYNLVAAQNAVIDAACAETDAEHHAQNLTTQALEAPTGSPRLSGADDARRAKMVATAQRRAAVARLREAERS